jgi:hypothetical protein
LQKKKKIPSHSVLFTEGKRRKKILWEIFFVEAKEKKIINQKAKMILSKSP